jgi:hypothetical protein
MKSVKSVKSEKTNPNKETKNKGHGAGGANTNLFGKNFEDKTNNMKILQENGYTTTNVAKKSKKKHYYFLEKNLAIKQLFSYCKAD